MPNPRLRPRPGLETFRELEQAKLEQAKLNCNRPCRRARAWTARCAGPPPGWRGRYLRHGCCLSSTRRPSAAGRCAPAGLATRRNLLQPCLCCPFPVLATAAGAEHGRSSLASQAPPLPPRSKQCTPVQGEALPFQGTVAQLMEKLAAAGVGQRPVIFVSHRQGGAQNCGNLTCPEPIGMDSPGVELWISPLLAPCARSSPPPCSRASRAPAPALPPLRCIRSLVVKDIIASVLTPCPGSSLPSAAWAAWWSRTCWSLRGSRRTSGCAGGLASSSERLGAGVVLPGGWCRAAALGRLALGTAAPARDVGLHTQPRALFTLQ